MVPLAAIVGEWWAIGKAAALQGKQGWWKNFNYVVRQFSAPRSEPVPLVGRLNERNDRGFVALAKRVRGCR
jgi:hypothetical protein